MTTLVCATNVIAIEHRSEASTSMDTPLAADNPSTNLSPSSLKRLLPWLVAVAFFMESLDTTILNTAVPAISKALAVTPLSMKSVLASYASGGHGYGDLLE